VRYVVTWFIPGSGAISKEADITIQTVIPGFEFSDHDFLTMDRFKQLVTEEQVKEMEWLVREN
jgi:predicted cupin superfamily sugar epimerase